MKFIPDNMLPVDGGTTVSGINIFGDKVSALIPAPHQELIIFFTISEEHVQDQFPYLTADQHEFLISGLLPEDWEYIANVD